MNYAQVTRTRKRYDLTTQAELRDHQPADGKRRVEEQEGCAFIRTGNEPFDGLFALAVEEALENSVDSIQDAAYNNGSPISLKAYETGALWHYVWTRDLAYAVHLALAQFDPERRRLAGPGAKERQAGPAAMGQLLAYIVTGSVS